jgi:hypothetical protein
MTWQDEDSLACWRLGVAMQRERLLMDRGQPAEDPIARDLIDLAIEREIRDATDKHRTRPGQRNRWDRKRRELRTEQLRYEVGR